LINKIINTFIIKEVEMYKKRDLVYLAQGGFVLFFNVVFRILVINIYILFCLAIISFKVF